MDKINDRGHRDRVTVMLMHNPKASLLNNAFFLCVCQFFFLICSWAHAAFIEASGKSSTHRFGICTV